MTSMTKTASRFLPMATLLIAVLALAGCGRATGGPSATTVNVTLSEFTVTPSRSSANAGTITFHVANAGTRQHEFLVIQTNLAPDALPTDAYGVYIEGAAGTVVVDEIPGILPGNTADLVLHLGSGNYVLICNMTTGLGVGHYSLGMHAAFRVD